MNYSEIIKETAVKAGVSQKDARDVIDTLVKTIEEQLVAGEDVKIAGLGTFKIKETAQRNGRNPITGESLVIPASKKVSFSITKSLKDVVKGA